MLAKEFRVEPEDLDIQFREQQQFKKDKGISVQAHESYQRSKDALWLQAFETTLVKADKAIQENNGHQFLLAGDAYRRPNYQFGHGLNHGFRHAKYASEVFAGRMSADDYNKRCDELSKEIEVANSLLNKLGKQGRNILVSASNERPGRVRAQFEGLKNPQAAEIIAPIHQHLNTISLLTGHKSSAKRLINEIIKSDQRPWDILNLISKELYRANSRPYPLGHKHDNYIKALEKAYAIAVASYKCERNIDALSKDKDLMEKMQFLESHMTKKGHPAYNLILQAILNNDVKLLESYAQSTHARRTHSAHNKTESPEDEQMRLLTQALVKNSKGEYSNESVFISDIKMSINILTGIKNKSHNELSASPTQQQPLRSRRNTV